MQPEEQQQVTIQQPTIGRAVIFTATMKETEADGVRTVVIDSYAGIITRVYDGGVIDIVTFGPTSTYHNLRVTYDCHGRSGTWQYPLHCKDSLVVSVPKL